MKQQTANKLTVNIYENRALMGLAAADVVCNRIIKLLTEQEFVNIIFAAAPSQNEFLGALTESKTVEWSRINAFHMDEYIGLPKNDAHTFAYFLHGKIFSQLNFHSINYINGNAGDLNGECDRYAKLLQQYPADIVCMGIGENGHIAFNDPHVADFNDPLKVKIVTLDTACRQQQVNDGCFAGLSEVPEQALTLTVPALMAGRYIYCMVPGAKKANAVYNTVYADIIETYPSAILRKHDNAILFLDGDSSSLLYSLP